ncbi:MAG: terminase [Lachnospiraceae bacterium]|nr:terminase [Lachnospiraceae bacterium]
MPRKPDKRIEQAQALYLKGLKLVDISKQLDLPEGTVRRWKSTYKWDNERSDKESERSDKNKGAQPGNKNASGHGAPKKNSNAEKHGLFRKYLPEETFSIIDEMQDKSPLDLIWDAIQIQYAAIIRSQQIMYVTDREDKTIEKVGTQDGNVIGEKWEVQQAWDKQAGFLKAQSRAIDSLKNMIKDYLQLEGTSKADAKEQVEDWKAAIIAIAKRRREKADG